VTPALARTEADLGTLFEEQFDYVWDSLRRLGTRPADLEDLVHEVFLRVHGRLSEYDGSRPVRPWLFGFAFRVASEHRRLARHRIEVLDSSSEAVDPGRPADEGVHAGEERALVEQALARVDLDQRAVLLMHDVDEVPIPQVARELGIPVNTAYSRLRLGRESFASAVARLQKARSR
jgi:RNA polymerase sigma-70 factor (ECF subfamily)